MRKGCGCQAPGWVWGWNKSVRWRTWTRLVTRHCDRQTGGGARYCRPMSTPRATALRGPHQGRAPSKTSQICAELRSGGPSWGRPIGLGEWNLSSPPFRGTDPTISRRIRRSWPGQGGGSFVPLELKFHPPGLAGVSRLRRLRHPHREATAAWIVISVLRPLGRSAQTVMAARASLKKHGS